MKTGKRILVILAALLFAAALLSPCHAGIWVKGNTHDHTTHSDGDVDAPTVAKWYKDHGYNFLVITDHEYRTDPAESASVTDDKFILIPGEEVTTKYDDIELHCNALGIPKTLRKPTGTGALDALRKTLDLIVDAGGIPQINHPGFQIEDNSLISEACAGPGAPKGPFLIEVYNHYAAMSNPALVIGLFESAWDMGLSAGVKMYGVASDDTHRYKKFGPKQPNPGYGWIMVNVDKLTPESVLSSIRQGKFYASTGVELAAYSFDGKAVRVSVKPKPGLKYTIHFVGKGGFTLSDVLGTNGLYKLKGGPSEMYVRARVDASDGTYAWTQPVWPRKK